MTAITAAVRSLGGDFPAEAFGRTYRLWPQVGDFSDLFTWDDLNEIIARHRLEPPRLRLFNDGAQVPQHAYAHPVVTKRHTVWHRIEPGNLHHQLNKGASLVLDAVDTLHRRVEHFAEALERHLRTDVQVNLYASWTSKEGFGLHFDDHDVVVVQLEGAKRWKIHEPTRIAPLRIDVEAPEPPQGESIAEIVLRAGDMLYLPRGWWHAVAAAEDRSLHLTCGLKPTTGADLLAWLADQLRASATVRANLPHFASREEQVAHWAALLKEFTSALHDGVIEEFLCARGAMDPGRPMPSLPFVGGIPADEHLQVRLTASGAWYEVDGEGRVVMSAGGQDRMLSARAHAYDLLDLTGAAGGEVWGYAGRTLSGAAMAADSPAWLRLVSDPEGKAGGKLWEGPREAERLVPPAVPRPRLIDLVDWPADGWDYRAELYEYVTTPPVSRSPVLHHSVELSDTWWHNLHQALDRLSRVPTSREAVREQYIRRRVPEYTGITPGEIAWTTGHGDLHWANLTSPPLSLLDWEGWGAAPVGYDAATLYLHSLPIPDLAERVRVEFAHVLGTPTGRVGELTACTEILQAAARVPFYSDLADSVRQHLDHLS